MNIITNQKKTASVSVVIPSFCCSKTIRRAVESVASQTLLPKELILIEDASDDNNKTINALNFLKELYSSYFLIKIIFNHTNIGAGESRNRGWDLAESEYVAFLDADDSWHPNKLELQYSWMKDHPEILLTAHSSAQISDASLLKQFNFFENFYPLSVNKFLLFNYIPTRSVMLKCKIQYRFLAGKRYAEDYLLWLSIALDRHPIYFLDLPLSYSYKNEFGDAGLTAHLSKAHAGLVDTYQQLIRNRKVSLSNGIILIVFSYVKYMRRLAIVFFRKPLNKLRSFF